MWIEGCNAPYPNLVHEALLGERPEEALLSPNVYLQPPTGTTGAHKPPK
jgi:hypothetical protein